MHPSDRHSPTTPAGKLVFGIFAAPAEFKRKLISERTIAGLASARASEPAASPLPWLPVKFASPWPHGRTRNRRRDLCRELGITRQTLYRHVSLIGKAKPDGLRVLN